MIHLLTPPYYPEYNAAVECGTGALKIYMFNMYVMHGDSNASRESHPGRLDPKNEQILCKGHRGMSGRMGIASCGRVTWDRSCEMFIRVVVMTVLVHLLLCAILLGDDEENAILGLLKDAASNDLNIRMKSLSKLRKFGAKPLLKIVNNIDNDSKIILIDVLGEIGDRAAINPLADMFEDNSGKIRVAVVKSLSNFKDARCEEILLKAIKDSDYDVRYTSLRELAFYSIPKAMNNLIETLDTDDPDLRIASFKALGALGNNTICDKIRVFIDDNDSIISAWAAVSLGQLGDNSVVDILIGMIHSKKPIVSKARYEEMPSTSMLLAALECIGPASFAPLVRKFSDGDIDPQCRNYAVDIISKFGGERALDLLIHLLDDNDSQVRISAASGLGNIGDKKAVHPLVCRTSSEEDVLVRTFIFMSLFKLNDNEAIEVFINGLEDKTEEIRKYSLSGLQRLSGNSFGQDEIQKWKEWYNTIKTKPRK
jgi:HEAT repeat protein